MPELQSQEENDYRQDCHCLLLGYLWRQITSKGCKLIVPGGVKIELSSLNVISDAINPENPDT